jgi:hypothetical protein
MRIGVLFFALDRSDDIPDIKGEDISHVIDQNEIQETRENALPVHAPPHFNLVLHLPLILHKEVDVHIP